jgi:hypothetical protein
MCRQQVASAAFDLQQHNIAARQSVLFVPDEYNQTMSEVLKMALDRCRITRLRSR